MSRTLDSLVLRAFQARVARRVHLIELQFSGGTIYLTTGAQDLVWNGHTWVALGGALRIGPVQETHDPDAQATELQLGGVDQTIISAMLSENYRGRLVNVYRVERAVADNLIPYSEDGTHWTLIFGGTRTTGVDDPLGGTRAFTITDASTSQSGGINQNLTYARDGVKEAAVGLRFRGTQPGTGCSVHLYDGTAAADIAKVGLHFTNGIPSVISTLAGTTVLELAPLAADYWRLRFRASGGLAAHTNNMTIYPAAAPGGSVTDTGALDVFGGQVTDGGPAVLYQPTSGAAVHELDVLGTPFLAFTGYLQEGFRLEEQRPQDPTQTPTATVRARVVSRAAGLHQVRGIRTNVVSHQMAYAGDTFCQHVAGLMYQPIYFGQKAPPGSRTD